MGEGDQTQEVVAVTQTLDEAVLDAGQDDALVRRTIADLAPLPTFSEASERVLQFLHGRLGMGLWMVTRAAGQDWVVLHSRDEEYGVTDGDVFAWSDSYCSRMVREKDRGSRRTAQRCLPTTTRP